MRILGSIPHPIVKISILHMNMRYVIKFEMGGLEQTYKIRESDYINSVESIHQLVDDVFIESILDRFAAMQKDLGAVFGRMVEEE